jgi:hypothetical protein
MHTFFAAALLTLIALTGCSGDRQAAEEETARKRELLVPIDVQTRRAERLEQARVLDEDGIPIPSDMKIAGIDIPRSFELLESRERKWHLQSRQISPEALGRYMELRLFTGSLERKGGGGIRIKDAQLKDALEQPRVTVNIAPIAGNPHACRMRIEQAAPITTTEHPSEAQVQAQMKAQRQYAD